MGWSKQVRNFVRVLIVGAPSGGGRYSDSLSKTAADLRYVNMSIEDDRLENRAMNDSYVTSLDD